MRWSCIRLGRGEAGCLVSEESSANTISMGKSNLGNGVLGLASSGVVWIGYGRTERALLICIATYPILRSA